MNGALVDVKRMYRWPMRMVMQQNVDTMLADRLLHGGLVHVHDLFFHRRVP